MKTCRKCGKQHTEPSDKVIGRTHGYIWFNCTCGSTILLTDPNPPSQGFLEQKLIDFRGK